MLDKQHDGHFKTARGDDYIYIGGEINGYKVVVATWPAGQNYGTGATAALLAHLVCWLESLLVCPTSLRSLLRNIATFDSHFLQLL